MKKNITEINESIWSLKNSALEYSREIRPFPAEEIIIKRFGEDFGSASILDIGVGAGRTTSFLSKICGRYIGIDYSPEMINVAEIKYPEATLYCMDARNLSDFEDSTFDMVWFSYNGIDYVSHHDRLKILREIRRVVKAQGHFIFSSHNRDIESPPAYHFENIRLSLNPLRSMKRLVGYFCGIWHSIKLSKYAVEEGDYAIRNDQAQGYKLLTYYISSARQREQLEAAGFTLEALLGISGESLEIDNPYQEGYSIYYVAKAG